MKTLLAITSLFLISIPVFANDCNSDSTYGEVTKQDLQKIVSQKSALIVDVNSKESFDKTHIPGAIHFESNEANFAKVLPKKKDTLIVAYCGGPMCSAWKKAAEEACNMGYTNVKHFKGGISGWNKKS